MLFNDFSQADPDFQEEILKGKIINLKTHILKKREREILLRKATQQGHMKID